MIIELSLEPLLVKEAWLYFLNAKLFGVFAQALLIVLVMFYWMATVSYIITSSYEEVPKYKYVLHSTLYVLCVLTLIYTTGLNNV